jgi:hypothetical protein
MSIFKTDGSKSNKDGNDEEKEKDEPPKIDPQKVQMWRLCCSRDLVDRSYRLKRSSRSLRNSKSPICLSITSNTSFKPNTQTEIL